MISLYSGTPGSGKSYDIAEKIYFLNKKKSFIISNFTINKKKLKNPNYYYYLPITQINLDYLNNFFEMVKNFYGVEKLAEDTIYLIIDEAQIIFNARAFQDKSRLDWIKFFSIHRHMGYNVILISQFIDMLDRQMRFLIEYNYIHRRLKNTFKFGWLIELLCFHKIFISVKIYVPLKYKVSSSFLFGHKFFYNLYDTFDLIV